MSDAEPEGDGRNDLAAAALGLLALAVACAAPALFVLAPDDGRRGAWMFAERGTGRRCAGSPWRASSAWGRRCSWRGWRCDRARRWPAKIPAALAIAARACR